MIARGPFLVVAAVALLACAALRPAPSLGQVPADAYRPGEILNQPNDPVVAIVDGRRLHLSEVGDLARELPDDPNRGSFDSFYPALLDGLVDHAALELKARRLRLDETADVQRKLARAAGRTLEQALLNRVIEEQVTEAAIRGAWLAAYGGKTEIEAAHIRIILTTTEAAADEALARLRAGEDFAAVAGAVSRDPSAARGGDVGLLRRDQMQPAIADAAFALGAGTTTPRPVRGRLGWYVIRVEQRRSVPPPSFEEARDSLRRSLTEQAVRQAVAQARSEASVQQFNLDGSSMTDQGRALLPYLPGLPDD